MNQKKTRAGAWTPGPWKVRDRIDNATRRCLIVASDDHYRALATIPDTRRFDAAGMFENGGSYAEIDATARLMAAAPALYDALIAAKRELWAMARYTWTIEDFNRWAVVEQINAALTAADDEPRGPAPAALKTQGEEA